MDDTMTDLCQRLVASDRTAFERLFRLMRQELLRYTTSIVRDDILAHDLVQDVFVSLWGLRTTLDPSQPLKPYLYRMARNRAYRHLRDTRLHAEKHQIIQQQTDPRSPNDTATEAQLDDDTLTKHLQRWLQKMPDRQREAIVLSRFHELSHAEIAAIMDISPRTVNNHIMRALGFLQERLLAFEPAMRDL